MALLLSPFVGDATSPTSLNPSDVIIVIASRLAGNTVLGLISSTMKMSLVLAHGN
jgi:hypothetical protein